MVGHARRVLRVGGELRQHRADRPSVWDAVADDGEPSSAELRCERISRPKAAAMSAASAASPSTVTRTSSGTKAPEIATGALVGGAVVSDPGGGGAGADGSTGAEPAAEASVVVAGAGAGRRLTARRWIGEEVDDQLRQDHRVGIGGKERDRWRDLDPQSPRHPPEAAPARSSDLRPAVSGSRDRPR